MPKAQKAILVTIFTALIASIFLYFYAYGGFNDVIEDKIASKKPVVLYFSASWCGSCNKQKPILYKVLEEHKNIDFFEIGSNLNKIRKRILFKKYKVQGIPTLLFINDGHEVKRLVGLQKEEELEKSFSSLVQ